MRPAPSRPAAAAVTATSQPQRYLTNDEAADYLRLSPRTLEKQRVIGGGPSSASSAAASCTRCPTSMPGPTSAATRPRPIPNTPSATRATTVMAADRRRVGGLRHVQPARASLAAARTARSVPRAAGDMAPRDSQDDGLSVLLACQVAAHGADRLPQRNVTIRVEGTQEHGIATIWDADVLIWAASQIVEARDAGLRPSRWIRATPYEILRFIGRGTSLNDYQRLKAALDRLQSTTVATSIRETTGRRLHRFSWINEWKELADASGTAGHRADLAGLVLCRRARRRPGADHRPGLFPLEGRYRTLAVPPGAQAWRAAGHGWQFDFRHLYRKSGSAAASRTSPTTCAPWWRGSRCPSSASSGCRTTTRAADLPARAARGTGITAGEPVDGLVLSGVPGIVLSGVRPSCYQEYENAGKPTTARVCVPSNLPNKNT